ncbi:helix-turn-helix domain-containing protein [Paenibacillus caseinilyticus]|uniref:helix-turn-helix domain-containing protein n=1 Tax=Paenibacillus caseinilyticus TaxID=3098138 RepID=UPI0022B8D689|nr:helix-turn-helix transcriptional regulator [Paenibacillus caseinilyticus]MCZ8518860.1 helix-turn-helix transcriptional regulator [Paenibacillus caseinilyticus]
MANISEAIKQQLKKKELNPSDLARMTGYAPQYIHELLAGKKRWNETTLIKACGALDLELTISEAE